MPAMFIIRSITEKVEQLGIHDRHHKVEGIIGIRDDYEHRCPFLSQLFQFHFIVGHQVTQLRNVKWG